MIDEDFYGDTGTATAPAATSASGAAPSGVAFFILSVRRRGGMAFLLKMGDLEMKERIA